MSALVSTAERNVFNDPFDGSDFGIVPGDCVLQAPIKIILSVALRTRIIPREKLDRAAYSGVPTRDKFVGAIENLGRRRYCSRMRSAVHRCCNV